MSSLTTRRLYTSKHTTQESTKNKIKFKKKEKRKNKRNQNLSNKNFNFGQTLVSFKISYFKIFPLCVFLQCYVEEKAEITKSNA